MGRIHAKPQNQHGGHERASPDTGETDDGPDDEAAEYERGVLHAPNCIDGALYLKLHINHILMSISIYESAWSALIGLFGYLDDGLFQQGVFANGRFTCQGQLRPCGLQCADDLWQVFACVFADTKEHGQYR